MQAGQESLSLSATVLQRQTQRTIGLHRLGTVDAPRQQWLYLVAVESISDQRGVENLVVGGNVALHPALAEGRQKSSGATPAMGNGKERHRPAEVSPVSAARRLGDGV